MLGHNRRQWISNKLSFNLMFLVIWEPSLKQLGRFASLDYNIYLVVDPTPVDVDHAEHRMGPQNSLM